MKSSIFRHAYITPWQLIRPDCGSDALRAMRLGKSISYLKYIKHLGIYLEYIWNIFGIYLGLMDIAVHIGIEQIDIMECKRDIPSGKLNYGTSKKNNAQTIHVSNNSRHCNVASRSIHSNVSSRSQHWEIRGCRTGISVGKRYS